VTITQDKSSELEINCFAYNNIAVDIENKINFDEFDPNNLYNDQVDYQTWDSQTKCVDYNLSIKSPTPQLLLHFGVHQKNQKCHSCCLLSNDNIKSLVLLIITFLQQLWRGIVLLRVLCTEIDIDDNCFFGCTNLDQSAKADASLLNTVGTCVVYPDTSTSIITDKLFNTQANGIQIVTITEDKISELEINRFAYNNIAVDIENKINFDEFGPNNLYNDQVDYQTLDS